jgi:hyperosmotically inducible periplasmic protein
MKAFLGSVVCAVAMSGLSGLSVGANAPQGGTATASDSQLDSRIEQRIHKDPSLKKHNIDVSVDGGVATLTGTVATERERAKAKQLATIKGIARVDNKIVVDQAAGTTGTVATAKEKTKAGAEKVVDKTKEGLSKTGEVITDAWITTRVKSKFVGEDLLKGSDINVDTNDHVVTLKGTVMSAAARARAVEQAKEVEGVHKVVDLLTIGPKKS